MDDNKLKFGVGVLVIAAIGIGIILTFLFGAFPRVLTGEYTLDVTFDSAEGIAPNTPVMLRGVEIGRVIEIELRKEDVLLKLGIDDKYPMTHEFIPRIGTGNVISGDSKLEFVKASEEELQKIHKENLPRIRNALYVNEEFLGYGKKSSDPFTLLFDLEEHLVNTMQSIQQAGTAVGDAGDNVNRLIDDARNVVDGADTQMDAVAIEAQKALEEFQGAMRDIRAILGDPELQASLQDSFAKLPEVLTEARKTLSTFDRVGAQFEKVGMTAERTVDNVDGAVDEIRVAVQGAKRTLDSAEGAIKNIERISEPVAENADQLVAQLMQNLANLDTTLVEARRFGATLNNSEGTVSRLLNDDEIYWQLRRIVSNVEDASAKIRPILDDARIFSDKIARDPRALGVRGALDKRPSGMGLK
ncbi:MlaD family protein [Stieleria varia]|uniref:Mce related protein n=1 Tax=Stieleria varia TaxID=2528005 RepID=A0A5C6AZ08_9BACT|nr:MlaD family protein [Stieleria varia]TWU04362.1 mce related protein [Stieleria varia]